MKEMKKLAPIMVLIAGFLWGSMGIFVRHINEYGMNSMDIVSVRVFGAMVVMGVFLLIYNRKLFIIKLKDIWCFVGTGIVSIVFFSYCYFTAIQIATLSIAAIMLYTAPCFVMLMSAVLFKERIGARKATALLMTLVGLVLVTGVIHDMGAISVKAILYGLGSGIGYALYSIFGRYALERKYHTYTISFYTFLFASVGALPFIKADKIVNVLINNKEGMLYAFGLIIFVTVVPYLTYTIGLSHMEGGVASVLATIEPVVATLIGVIIYKEEIDPLAILGVVLVLGATVLISLKIPKIKKYKKLKKSTCK